jgi:hypothetical protein
MKLDLLVLKMNQYYIMYKSKRTKGPQNMLGIYICRSRKKKRVKLPQTQSKDGNIDILRHWTSSRFGDSFGHMGMNTHRHIYFLVVRIRIMGFIVAEY